jgi:CysZ protein
MADLLPRGPLGGLAAPLKALGFLVSRPRLWWLAFTPFLINLGLFILFFWFTYTRFDAWVRSFLPVGEGWWWQLLLYLLMVVLVLLLLIIEVYLFAVLGRIVAAPFLEILTRKVESLARPEMEAPPEMAFWQSIWRVVIQETKRVLIYLAVMAVLLILNLIPGLGSLLYAALAWLVTSFFLAGEFLDYPLERRGYSLGAKMRYTKSLGLTGIGFGASVFIMGLVPVLNLALLPLAAVGGTLLFLERPPLEPAKAFTQ